MKYDTPPNNPVDASSTSSGQDLRQRAETAFRKKSAVMPEDLAALSPDDARTQLHELRVHQIELAMQNEELRRTQQELDASRSRYFDLYDLAPVGYVTLNKFGVMQEINLTFAKLLGIPKASLAARPFTKFIFKDDQDVFYLHHKRLCETGMPQMFDLRMTRPDGLIFWAQLSVTGDTLMSFITVSDVTMRKQTEERLRQKCAELELFNEVTVERELRMCELKKEVNALLTAADKPEKYRICAEP